MYRKTSPRALAFRAALTEALRALEALPLLGSYTDAEIDAWALEGQDPEDAAQAIVQDACDGASLYRVAAW